MDYRFTHTSKPIDPLGWTQFADACRKFFAAPHLTMPKFNYSLWVVTDTEDGDETVTENPARPDGSSRDLVRAVRFSQGDAEGHAQVVGGFVWGKSNGSVVATVVGMFLERYLPGHYLWEVIDSEPNVKYGGPIDDGDLKDAITYGARIAQGFIDESMVTDLDNPEGGPYTLRVHYGEAADERVAEQKRTGEGHMRQVSGPGTDNEDSEDEGDDDEDEDEDSDPLLTGALAELFDALGLKVLDDGRVVKQDEQGGERADPEAVIKGVFDGIAEHADLAKATAGIDPEGYEKHRQRWERAHKVGVTEEGGMGDLAANVTKFTHGRFAKHGWLHVVVYLVEGGGIVFIDLTPFAGVFKVVGHDRMVAWSRRFIEAGFTQGADLVLHIHTVTAARSGEEGLLVGAYRQDEGLFYSGVIPLDDDGRPEHQVYVYQGDDGRYIAQGSIELTPGELGRWGWHDVEPRGGNRQRLLPRVFRGGVPVPAEHLRRVRQRPLPRL